MGLFLKGSGVSAVLASELTGSRRCWCDGGGVSVCAVVLSLLLIAV